MNKTNMMGIGIGACALACAGASILPFVVGAGILGAGSFGLSSYLGGESLEIILCAGGLTFALLALGFVVNKARKPAPVTCTTDASCGCSTTGNAIKP